MTLMRRWVGGLAVLVGTGCAFSPGGVESESGDAGGGTSAGEASTASTSAGTSSSDSAVGTSDSSTSDGLTTSGSGMTTSGRPTTTTTSSSTSTSTSSSTASTDGSTTESVATTVGVSTSAESSSTSGEPLDTIWCVEDCPSECASIGANLSCANDFESFVDPSTEPGCPTSELVHSNPAGPGDWVIRTAEGINSQWYGHGIRDHTTGTLGGNVFYGDLINGNLDVAYYQESISVEPDTAYVIEFYAKDTVTNEADHRSTIISVVLNGDVAIADYTLPSLQGDMVTYDRFTVGWFSGPSTTLEFEILNRQSQSGAGLDVAVDDVSVATCSVER